MTIKSALFLCGAAALAAMAPSAASAHTSFSFSIGSAYGNGYPGYGYDNSYDYVDNGYPGYVRHGQQHQDLDDEQDDVHDQLDEGHARAHAQGLDPYEH